MSVCVCVSACVYVNECVCVCVRACMHACVRECMRACVHACMCACVHACVCVYTCIHVHEGNIHNWLIIARTWKSTMFVCIPRSDNYKCCK